MRSTAPLDPVIYAQLEGRVGHVHLKQRLGIETDHEGRVFGQGRTFFHIENWRSVHALIRTTLRAVALHRRGRRNARAITVRRNEFVSAELPAAFDGFTLLHLSDMHLDMAADFPAVLIDAVRGLDYDACVMTGDYRAKTFGPFEPTLAALGELRPHLKGPVYGVLGNHDTIRMVPGIDALGIRLLLNECVFIEREGDRIYLAGIDDPHYYRADNFEKAADPIPRGAFSILLAHSPEVHRHAAHADFDVMLCGHTHGGQICLPGGYPVTLNARCARRYGRGKWRYHQMQGYTSSGSGACVVDVRLNCPPEVTLHRLRRGPA